MTGFAGFYFRSFSMREIRQRIKLILLLTGIFTAAAVFSVLECMEEISRRNYLAGCSFQTVSLAETGTAVYAGSVIRTGANTNLAEVQLFDGRDAENPLISGAENRLNGAFSGNKKTIWLTYGAAFAAGAGIGDHVQVLLKEPSECRELSVGEYLVDGILKPFGGRFEENIYDAEKGFAVIFPDEADAEAAASFAVLHLQFDTAERGDALEKGQLFKESKRTADYVGSMLTIVFPIFGAMLSAAVICMEYVQYQKRGRRRFAVLHVLGVRSSTLRHIHFTVFTASFAVSALTAMLCSRMISAKILGKYLPVDLSLTIMAAELLTALAVLPVCMIAGERRGLTGVLFDENTKVSGEG